MTEDENRPLNGLRAGRMHAERVASRVEVMFREMNGSTRSLVFLRIALGLVYFHFGFLKFFPDLSPAELLASQTIMRLSLSWLDAHQALRILAVLECTIGASLVLGIKLRWAFFLFLFHMLGTLVPLFVLPELTFKISPFAPTFEGQYILKNLVFIAAGWSVLFPHIRRAERDDLEVVVGSASENPIP